MKKWIIISISLALFLVGIDLFVATLNGTLVWFVKQKHVVITVDGQLVEGYGDRLFLGRKITGHSYQTAGVQLITITEQNRRATFWIEHADKSTPIPQFCSAWVAPSTPVFQVNVHRPPCFEVIKEVGGKSEAVMKLALIASGKGQVEFIAQDGRRIRAAW